MSDEPTAAHLERACEVMHDAYELAAVTQGWETQERSRKPWAEVPEANKETMRAAVRALMGWMGCERMAQAWDEGWYDRDNYSSAPFSPPRENPYAATPPGATS